MADPSVKEGFSDDEMGEIPLRDRRGRDADGFDLQEYLEGFSLTPEEERALCAAPAGSSALDDDPEKDDEMESSSRQKSTEAAQLQGFLENFTTGPEPARGSAEREPSPSGEDSPCGSSCACGEVSTPRSYASNASGPWVRITGDSAVMGQFRRELLRVSPQEDVYQAIVVHAQEVHLPECARLENVAADGAGTFLCPRCAWETQIDIERLVLCTKRLVHADLGCSMLRQLAEGPVLKYCPECFFAGDD